jgi:hypothetical protein
VGFHAAYRGTRDLDLFWQHRRVLGDAVAHVYARLDQAGFDTKTLQTGDTFARLSVRDGGEVILLDLVASPVPPAEAPRSVTVGAASFLVDTPHQILVNKLCALLSRSEPRDLEDVKVLLEAGGDLARALEDCPRQDAGFSPMTLAWAVRALPFERLATALNWAPDRIQSVTQFKDDLIDRILERSRPDI